FHCGPKRAGDADGPGEMHIVLVDNGRTRMLGDEFREMLRCIRCGACMNHCVVYRQIGGHAYGGTYPGPMGTVLTPVLDGLAASRDLPNACTMNRRCAEVCPVGIPLPTLIRAWRSRSWRERLEPVTIRRGIGLWAWVARRPALYRLASGMGVRALRLMGRGGWISSLPLAGGWTAHRDMPKPPGRTFMQQYRAQQKDRT
ncbi:4Fe-4S dicluster domain-containing protein, partial [Paracoccus sp. (in: a-proteobacteria)]|uniref:4Fe-4S dicluster domain-containing protein n=1 Tax=Paracoccus sp. TaxID=267 RepID=UPI003A8847A4